MSKASTYTFWDLISSYIIQIPIIQRDYAQGREIEKINEIRANFLDSLHHSIVSKKQLDLDFVYGSLKNDTVFIPLDGQQRLTTLFLLHWYLAVKAKKTSETQELLKRFTYETRTSSREFCRELVENGKAFEEEVSSSSRLSKLIKNASWFFLSWEKDPTIKSMLVMLDAIHKKFNDTDEFFEVLTKNTTSPITFQFIQLENFGLEDSLYIKMNGRGKPLSDFENFKAKFQQYLQEKEDGGELDENFTSIFMSKMDGKWTDLFWNYRNLDTNVFDHQIMNFFRAIIINNYAAKSRSRNSLDYLINNGKHISFAKYKEIGSLETNVIDDLFITLEVLNNDYKHIRTFLPNSVVLNERELFKKIVENNRITYTDRLQFYAVTRFFKVNYPNIESSTFGDWIRVIRNLTENTIDNDTSDFIGSIRSIDQLAENCNNILNYLTDETNKVTRFSGDQIEEERIKAVLILMSKRWKDKIEEAENHSYFRGQIGFILDFAGILEAYTNDSTLNWSTQEEDEYFDSFIKYFNKAAAIFDNSKLKINGNLWRRALLCKGDYLLKSGRNLSFVIDGFHRDISWKRLLRETDKRCFVKELLDQIDTNNIEENLKKVIGKSKINDWRKYFIKYPRLVENGGSRFIRKQDENNILLLNTTTTAGYCKEYYSYALYQNLKRRKVDVEYIETRGVDDYKYVQIDDSIFITYELKNSDWKYVIEFGQQYEYFDTQADVLDYLVNQKII